MIQITNKLKLISALDNYSTEYYDEVDLAPLMECADFEEMILLDPKNDKFEKYEIFLACLLNLHLTLLNNDEFELARQVQRAFNNARKPIQQDVDQGQDMETISWLWYANQFFNETIQSQLHQYSIKK